MTERASRMAEREFVRSDEGTLRPARRRLMVQRRSRLLRDRSAAQPDPHTGGLSRQDGAGPVGLAADPATHSVAR